MGAKSLPKELYAVPVRVVSMPDCKKAVNVVCSCYYYDFHNSCTVYESTAVDEYLGSGNGAFRLSNFDPNLEQFVNEISGSNCFCSTIVLSF